MPITPFATERDVLGYTLKEQIGSGGFGEVWSAEAPGGLMKAVKVVFGYHDQKHAQAEIKALDRVKQLRHPFLLSLERIEIYENQLVVVTELADGSLADVFNEYITAGQTGIPRDKLLKFLKSSAEALDYLSEEHGLQHLDIKPENLLMIGGHVKVADFGLIKDLQSHDQSLMTGMTPTYAAPELFDGRPHKNSDQYSLAIVYEEMLTGVRPFSGTTAAQLAAQHMHGKPNLRPLDSHDQAVVTKALAKDPELRFGNCVEMIEELANKKRLVKKAIRRTSNHRQDEADTMMLSGILEATPTNVGTAIISDTRLPFQASEIENSDPPECDPQNSTFRPTLVVGIGATANRVVQKYKHQLINRNGDFEAMPSVRILCIDTDREDLIRLQRVDQPWMLMPSEALEIPLRKPQDYRDRINSNEFGWLERRWIYNVPRSLQTDGLRPLGRLAYADHFDEINRRIQQAITEIVKVENVVTTAGSLGMSPGELKPRVFVVSSISGGVGSGMSLDLCYTIKLILHEAGLPSECINGLFLHSNYQRTRDPGISAANAFAFLTELRHFIENGYPGDLTLGVPDFDDEPPVDKIYINELGNNLSHTEYERQLGKVAEYISLSTTSVCSDFFDQCRKLEDQIDHLTLRTFGLSSAGPECPERNEKAVKKIGNLLIQKWTQTEIVDDLDINSVVNELLTACKLSNNCYLDSCKEFSDQSFDRSIESIKKRFIQFCLSKNGIVFEDVESFLDGLFGETNQGVVGAESLNQMSELVSQAAKNAFTLLEQGLNRPIEGTNLAIGRVLRTQEVVSDKLRKQREQLFHQRDNRQRIISEICGLIREYSQTHTSQWDSTAEELLNQYCNQRFELFLLNFAIGFVESLIHSVEHVRQKFFQYRSQITSLGSHMILDDEDGIMETSVSMCDIAMMSRDWIDNSMAMMADKAELVVKETLIKDAGGGLRFLENPTLIHDRLIDTITEAARSVLAHTRLSVSLDQVITHNGLTPTQVVTWISEQISEAKPAIRECGGAARLLIGLPSESEESLLPTAIDKQFGLNGKTIYGTTGNLILCFEGEAVPLANVAFRLLESRPDAIELVKRLHTRKDVEWISLSDLI